MAGFLLAAVALVALAAAFLLAPLWRGARRAALGLALALPVAAAGLYLWLGTPAALDPVNVQAPKTLEDAIVQLERRLAEEPGRVEGWVLLGRSRMAQADYAAARDAFARAHALLPDEPDLMVEYADALMRASDEARFPDQATELLERAIALQPGNQRGLFFLGLQRLQADRPAEAVALWERLQPLLSPAAAEALQPQLAAARERAGLPPREALVAAEGPSLEITVALDPALREGLSGDETVFVFARTADGAGLPVAVKRLAVSALPATVRLSDADGLMPAQTLFAQPRVRLMARVSRSGDAAAAPGDLEAEPVLLDVADGASARLDIGKVVE